MYTLTKYNILSYAIYLILYRIYILSVFVPLYNHDKSTISTIYIYRHISLSIYIHMYIHVSISIYVCIYIYIYVYSQPIVLSAELNLYYKYQQELCSYVCTCLYMSVHVHVLALTRTFKYFFKLSTALIITTLNHSLPNSWLPHTTPPSLPPLLSTLSLSLSLRSLHAWTRFLAYYIDVVSYILTMGFSST